MLGNLSDIRTKVRALTGRLQTYQLSNTDLDSRVNEFYQRTLPMELTPEALVTGWYWHTTPYETCATGDGATVSFSGGLSVVPEPSGVRFSDGTEVFLSDDSGVLYGTLGGTGTISYDTGAYSLTFATAPGSTSDVNAYYEVAVIPEELLVVYAPVTVAGMNASLVDSYPEFASIVPQAGTPTYVYLHDRRVTLSPAPDDAYLVSFKAVKRPDALVNTTDTPVDTAWWQYIALGAALSIVLDAGDEEKAALIGQLMQAEKQAVQKPWIVQRTQLRAKGAF